MTEVTREIVRLYRVDGIFSNRWAGSGMCYCEHCRENFAKFSGLELPRTLNAQDRARREYIVWRQARLFELWRLWDGAIKEINPKASFIANAGGGALSELDMKSIGELAPTLFADRQARHGLIPRWLKVVEELYGWHYANERYLRNERSLARVGMVYSQQTAAFYGGERAKQN